MGKGRTSERCKNRGSGDQENREEAAETTAAAADAIADAENEGKDSSKVGRNGRQRTKVNT